MTSIPEQVDVLIIGAGVSGIAAAHYIQNRSPNKSFTIVEARDSIGGTWDLFRYPGIRSDSDLYTFGYSFKPWTRDAAFASGSEIKTYLQETIDEFDLQKHIHFNHKSVAARWDTPSATWTVDIQTLDGTLKTIKCSVLNVCAGYYDYEEGYTPDWDSISKFKGQVVHPQAWPEDLDYTEKKIIVIGSGATAITLIPSLSEKAGHVTMLQRSPSYVSEMPAKDWLAPPTRKMFGQRISHKIIRWKNIIRTIFYFQLARRYPDYVAEQLRKAATATIGEDFDVKTHFTPTYKPWDQRVCVDKDGEFFRSLGSGKASIVTDTIETFVKDGIKVSSGDTLEADIIITATGLNMRFMGGMALTVDNAPIDLSKTYMYKGMSFSGVPNLTYSIGYTNASWTLKCELIARYVCRLINDMERKDMKIMTPIAPEDIDPQKALDLDAGYISRAEAILPKQGAEAPWRVHQNYVLDKLALGTGKLDDGAMVFSNAVNMQAAE